MNDDNVVTRSSLEKAKQFGFLTVGLLGLGVMAHSMGYGKNDHQRRRLTTEPEESHVYITDEGFNGIHALMLAIQRGRGYLVYAPPDKMSAIKNGLDADAILLEETKLTITGADLTREMLREQLGNEIWRQNPVVEKTFGQVDVEERVYEVQADTTTINTMKTRLTMNNVEVEEMQILTIRKGLLEIPEEMTQGGVEVHVQSQLESLWDHSFGITFGITDPNVLNHSEQDFEADWNRLTPENKVKAVELLWDDLFPGEEGKPLARVEKDKFDSILGEDLANEVDGGQFCGCYCPGDNFIDPDELDVWYTGCAGNPDNDLFRFF